MEPALSKRYNLAYLEQLYKQYLSSGKNKHRNTVKNYLSDLRSFYWWRVKTDQTEQETTIEAFLQAVHPSNIDEYKQFLIKGGIPSKTINRRLSGLRYFFDFCVNQQWIVKNPARHISNVSPSSAFEKAVSPFEKYEHSYPSSARVDPTPVISAATPETLVKTPEVDMKSSQSVYALARPKAIYAYTFIACLVIFTTVVLNALSHQLFNKTPQTQAIQNTPFRTGRTLLFTGSLHDALGNTILTKTNVQFKLYPREKGGRILYKSGVCSVYPDQTSSISLLIGKDCGKQIPISLFSEYQNLYLGVTVGTDPEMRPRKQIPTSSFALNSAQLLGLAPGSIESSIPFISSTGEILINAKNPTLRSSTETETLLISSAQGLMLESAGAGNITLAAKESGNLKFLIGGVEVGAFSNTGKFGVGTGTPDVKLEVQDNLEQFRITYGESAYASFTTTNDGDLIIDPSGDDAFILGNLGIGTTATGSTLSFGSGATVNLASSTTGLNIESGLFNIDSENNRVGIGTTAPASSLHVVGTGQYTSTLTAADGFTLTSGALSLTTTSGSVNLTLTSGQNAFNLNSGLFSVNTSNSRVGIGTTAPGARLDVVGGQTRIELSTQYSQRLCHGGADDGSTQSVLLGDCSSGGADLAEYYNQNSNLEPGDVVIPAQEPYSVDLSTRPYELSVIGIVSTNPSGEILGSTSTSPDRRQPIVLSGRAPTKISLENGSISVGDPLTTSSIPGVVMKATTAGPIVGIALEKFDGTEKVSRKVHIEETERSSALPTYRSNPTEWNETVGKIMVAVNVSWYDPLVKLTASGDFHINTKTDTDEQYVYEGKPMNQLSDISDDFVTQARNEIEIRLINLTSEGKTAQRTIIKGLLESPFILADSIYTKLIKTDQIITNSAQITNATINKLVVRELVSEEKITSPLIETGKLITTELAAEEASISGELVAQNVRAENISSLEKDLSNTSYQVSSQTENIKDIQKFITDLQNKPLPQPDDYSNIAESIPSSDLSTETQDNLVIYGQSTLFDTTILGTFIAGSISLRDNEVLSLSHELRLSALERVNILDGAVTVDRNGTLTTRGSLIAHGGVKTNRVEPVDGSNALSLVAKDRVQIINTEGLEVASIDASGSAKFADLSLSTSAAPAIIAADQHNRERGINAPAVITNATAAGNAILPTSYKDLVIYNNKIKDATLVYITATSSTQNQALYVSKKQVCTTTSECIPYFVVSTDEPINQDITFNWWLVN